MHIIQNRKEQQQHLSIYFPDRFKKTDAKESNIQESRHNAKSKEILQMIATSMSSQLAFIAFAKSRGSTLN